VPSAGDEDHAPAGVDLEAAPAGVPLQHDGPTLAERTDGSWTGSAQRPDQPSGTRDAQGRRPLRTCPVFNGRPGAGAVRGRRYGSVRGRPLGPVRSCRHGPVGSCRYRPVRRSRSGRERKLSRCVRGRLRVRRTQTDGGEGDDGGDEEDDERPAVAARESGSHGRRSVMSRPCGQNRLSGPVSVHA
jgi:hypothetical protein